MTELKNIILLVKKREKIMGGKVDYENSIIKYFVKKGIELVRPSNLNILGKLLKQLIHLDVVIHFFKDRLFSSFMVRRILKDMVEYGISVFVIDFSKLIYLMKQICLNQAIGLIWGLCNLLKIVQKVRKLFNIYIYSEKLALDFFLKLNVQER